MHKSFIIVLELHSKFFFSATFPYKQWEFPDHLIQLSKEKRLFKLLNDFLSSFQLSATPNFYNAAKFSHDYTCDGYLYIYHFNYSMVVINGCNKNSEISTSSTITHA